MGDAGALFLGVLLAVPTITIGGRTDFAFSGNTYFFFAPAADPGRHPRRADPRHGVLVRAAACVERQRWHQADAGHLHHRLMRLGHGPRRTVVILWAWTALLSGVALVPDLHEARATRSCRSSSPALALLLFAWFHPGCPVAAGAAGTGARTPPAQADRRRDVVDLDRAAPQASLSVGRRGARDPSRNRFATASV